MTTSSTDFLNVVLNFHQTDQFSARILLELLMALEEGVETHYYLQYGDPESTLEIQETLSRFCSHKTATLSTTLPKITIPSEWIENDPNQQSFSGNHTYKNSTQKQKIFQWNLSIFKYIHQLDHFLAIEPDCLFLKQQWAQPIYQAFLDRKQPIIGHLKQGTIDHQLVPTHFAGCSVYDGLALRQLPLEQYFSERYENPWWSLRDRPGTTTANNAFLGPVFSGYDTSYDYFLYALYLRELTGSNNPLDWTNQHLESREDLIVCDFRSRLTIEAILENYYGKVPLLHGVKDDAARQVILRTVQSQGLADRPLYPIGRSFAAPAIDRTRPVDQPAENYQALNLLRPDNSGLLSIADLRGQFAGKRCFIIGNGPSLKKTDLSRLQNEFTFGLNRIYLNYEAMGFEPTFYCCVNSNVTEQFAAEIDRLNSVKFVTDRARNSLKNHWNTFFMQSIPKIGFNENLNDLAWHEGWTVTYCAMQVAFHLGFEAVILVGVDHYFKESGEPNKAVTATGPDANHFHPEYFGKGVVWQYPDLERSEQSYRIAKEVYNRHNRRILDATIGGHLQIFPKANFDELMGLTAQPLSPEQQEKTLLKRHPYPFAIFLPTEKIPYPQRVEGLQRVVEIYETKYQSIYRPQLQALRDQCKGKKRAFVIGNGPSLNQTDLSLLKDEITFGVNGIFLKFQDSEFRPTFYVVEDHLVAEDRQEAINQLRGPIKLFPTYLAYCLNEADDTVFYNHVPRRSYPNGFDFSTDASDRTYTGCTVTFSCLQLAYYFGFQEIYLIGVDCNYEIPQDVEENQEYSVTTLDMKSDDTNHFHPDYFGKGFRWHDPQVDKMRDAYAEARKVCEANGVTIYNATVGGKLEVFPRVDYYSLFSEPPATPRLLVIDLTRIGENTATGQMKQALFQDWTQENLLQVYITDSHRFGLYAPSAEQSIEHYTDTDALLAACVRFAPNVIYYRPVADHPYLHDFACAAIDRLSAATVIHIVDDWPQRLQQQNPDLYSEFDRSLRSLFHKASACLSICSAMSTAFQTRYGVNFIPIANCIDPADWTPPQTNQTNKTDRPFTIRYVGSLAADMTLESVLDIAKAVAALQSEVAVQLEIYTLKRWKDKMAEAFAHLPGVSIHESERSLPEYRQLLMEADALLIAYNFDPKSIAYVRYSMANKFPECLASATPVLVYGPIDVATVAYAAEIGCTQLVLERNSEKLKATIRDLITSSTYFQMLGKVAQRYAFDHHSVTKVRTQFHKILHNATTAKPTLRLQQAISPIEPISAIQQTNRHRFGRVVLGQFAREQGMHIDETQVVAHLMSDLPQGSIMVDVGAHHGTALNSFAERGWRVFAYEPDPDNRQILTQRIKNRSNVTIDNRAVSDRAGNTLTLYASQESTGISTLTPFRDTHVQRCQVMTTTVAQICAEHQLSQIDFLKIDTEGYDLMVLKGVPWEQIQPRVIECEFEDSKTVPLGYTFHDLAQYLVDKGYTVLVSEWHPVIRYGIQHDWYRLITYPCQLATPQAWGNLLAFKHPPALDQVATVAQSLVKAKAAKLSTPAPKHDAMNHQTPAIEERNGMNSTPLKVSTDAQLLASQPSGSQLNPAQNGHSSPVAVQPDEKSSVANSMPPSPQPTRLATGLLRRISRYYSRWPLGVAILAAALHTAAMVDDLPFRWAFSGSGTLLLLFLVGHAASKADFSLEVGDRAQVAAEQADQKATSAFNRGTRAIDRAKKASQTANEFSNTARSALETANQASSLSNSTIETSRLALETSRSALETSHSALETANDASGRTEVALEVSNRASSTAKLAAETANQSLGKANVALETSKQVSETAAQLKRANSLNAGLFQPFDRQLSAENLETLMDFWLPTLNLSIDRRALGYLAHRICLCEDACSGRLATSVQDMLLRLLVARSVKNRELSVLEIGSLFGINLATIYDTCRGNFDTIHLSAIDPLAGYYDKSAADLITQVPVTRKIFEHNLRQIDVPVQDVTLIQGLSTEEAVLEKAGLRQYNLLIIDGDHSYTGVKFDFDHYASAVDLGGYILFDDYGTKDWPEVTEFVDHEVKPNPCVEFIGASWRTAVFKVVRRNLG